MPGCAPRPAAPRALDSSSVPLVRFFHPDVSDFAFATPESPSGPPGTPFGVPPDPKWGPGGPIRAPGNFPWQPGGPHWTPRAPKGCPGGNYGSLPEGSRTPKMKLSLKRERCFRKHVEKGENNDKHPELFGTSKRNVPKTPIGEAPKVENEALVEARTLFCKPPFFFIHKQKHKSNIPKEQKGDPQRNPMTSILKLSSRRERRFGRTTK